MAKGENIHEKEVLTSELAAIVGKTPQWIRQLTRDGALKQVGRGKYRLGEAIQAYILHAAGGKEDDKKPRFIDEKTEHERIKKEKAALELAVMKGELHRAEDVRAEMADMLTSFRSRILGIPTKLGPQLLNISELADVTSILTKEMRSALTALADYDPDKFAEGYRNGPEG
ncbi:hypothetical protein ERICIV_03439 [Paenibacillus larvae subsp. larvae]|uniref:Phage DNA packaging protein, Nu1 subunit of terminase n=1 Tax=Paenibacillus larvae subsp. larvae TaxID=147375 RepID=A0A2L1UHH7_9BACL|nr:hypothetical protein [Paenibacillus larvae]AQT84163.1 hypothetical protein B1222_06795 [Paenibacillus larvae subsp. pulvifaciens]AQZ46143.1 hypothetical protein B5S25_05435 [Paenibacillus larvae subsp. pulvifaciens]AVF27805.1 hypothetical protein ERICIII_03696 [Paenibacillus larvae subsp. larvae]AVF32308.1 hypothetical protein ERICIV_03439 [Paenibacillus larvae subsp. larvae]MBH0342722.1 hypothetical protein [Paenibacillus larvae]